jgi:hypothetical protein
MEREPRVLVEGGTFDGPGPDSINTHKAINGGPSITLFYKQELLHYMLLRGK